MIAGLVAAWPAIKRFWWIAPLVALSFVVLFQRANIAGKAEKLAVASAKVEDLTAANKDAAATIEAFKQQRIDNDAIAEAVAAKIGTTTVREVNTRTIIEKAAKNEPAVRDWLSVPVPDSVRGALHRNKSDTPAG